MTYSSTDQRLPRGKLLAFSVPCVVQSTLMVPVVAIFPTIYEKYYAANFAAVGLAMAVARGLDALVDPTVAYLSDRTRTRIGARKPWLIAGGLLGMIGIWQLFLPRGNPDAVYFLIWSSVIYLAWSMMQVPHDAWGAELSGDYRERSRIFAFKSFAGQFGSFVFLGAPLLLHQWFGFATTEMTPGVIRIIGVGALFALPLTLAIAVLRVPTVHAVESHEAGLFRTLGGLVSNRPYRLFLFIFAIQGLALGVYAALLYPFLDGYLKIGDQISWIMTVTALAGIVSTPAWLWIANRFGKHQAWAAGAIVMNVALVGWAFAPIGPSALVPSLIVSTIYGLFSTSAGVCYPSILADINDYGQLKNGTSRPGTYFAGVALLVKVTSAVGGGLALVAVGAVGFTTKVGAVMSQHTLIATVVIFIGVHTVLQLVAALLIFRYPLTQARQTIVRRSLDQRARRLSDALVVEP